MLSRESESSSSLSSDSESSFSSVDEITRKTNDMLNLPNTNISSSIKTVGRFFNTQAPNSTVVLPFQQTTQAYYQQYQEQQRQEQQQQQMQQMVFQPQQIMTSPYQQDIPHQISIPISTTTTTMVMPTPHMRPFIADQIETTNDQRQKRKRTTDMNDAVAQKRFRTPAGFHDVENEGNGENSGEVSFDDNDDDDTEDADYFCDNDIANDSSESISDFETAYENEYTRYEDDDSDNDLLDIDAANIRGKSQEKEEGWGSLVIKKRLSTAPSNTTTTTATATAVVTRTTTTNERRIDTIGDGTLEFELNVVDILKMISTPEFISAASRMTRPSMNSMFIARGGQIEREKIKIAMMETKKQVKVLQDAAAMVLKTIQEPNIMVLDFETVSHAIPNDVWCIIGRYVMTNCVNFTHFLSTLVGFGKVVRSHILKGFLSDPRWMTDCGNTEVFPNATNLFYFCNAIWQPVDAHGEVIGKRKKKTSLVSPEAFAVTANPNLDANYFDTDEDNTHNVRNTLMRCTAGKYVFPGNFVSNMANFRKSECTTATFSRIMNDLMDITTNNDLLMRSVMINGPMFEESSVEMGKKLWSTVGSTSSVELAERLLGFKVHDVTDTIIAKAGQKLFFNQSVSKQYADYMEYFKSLTPAVKNVRVSTHRVSFFVNHDIGLSKHNTTTTTTINANSTDASILTNVFESLMIVKIKRPNSKAEKENYSPLTGKGVQVKNIKYGSDLFSFL